MTDWGASDPKIGPGNLDPRTAGDNWSTFEYSQDGYHLTHVLPALPGDRLPDDATGFMGDAYERFKKTGQEYGTFTDENEAQAFMRTQTAQESAVTQAQRSFLNTTSVGRVMRAFGVGAGVPFEGEPGLSPEATESLRKAGMFRSSDPTQDNKRGPLTRTLETFNEAMIIPAAKDLDSLLRLGISPLTSIAHGIGQISEETGLSWALGYHSGNPQSSQAENVANDILGALDTMAIVTGVHAEVPISTALSRRNRIASSENLRGDQIPTNEKVSRFLKDEYGGSPPEEHPPFPSPDEPVTPPGKMDAEPVAGKEPPPPPDAPRLQAAEPPQRKAGNINLDRINAPEDVKAVILDTAEASRNNFETARRGSMTFEDMSNLANAMGMTPAQLAKRKVGQAFNAEEAVAARNLLVTSATKVRELAKEAAGGSDEAVAAFQQAVTRHAAIQEQVSGMTAEAGRALASFNIKSEAGDAAKQLAGLIEQAGGRDNIAAMIESINGLDTPEQVSAFVAKAHKATTMDKIIEAWINGLLSGPPTHVANVVSNSLVAANTIAETAVASGIGAIRVGLGIGNKDRIVAGEAGARAFAMIQGAKDGVKVARRAFSEDLGNAVGKVERKRLQAIGGVTGRIVRIPTRFLGAEDAFFQEIGRRQEIDALAHRKAASEGLSGKSAAQRIAQLRADPTPEMIDAAEKAKLKQTFNQPLGDAGKAVQKYFNTHPILKFIAPFIRTPVNIVKYAGERTPLGLFGKEVRENLAGKNGAVARDTQAARITIGTSLTVAAFAAASNGQITGGGPTDPRARALLYMSGWQPYSVKIGDTYYSYARMDPFATFFGAAADAYEIQHTLSSPDAGDIGGLILASVSKNLLNKTWLQGPADLMQAVEDPERYGSAWIRGLSGSFIPSAIAQFARTQDPYLRDARTIIDGLKARIPGLSETLLPKRDLWGEPIKREGSVGPDMISPIYQTQIKGDLIAREMLRLGIWKAPVPRQIRGVDLTPEQYDDFQKIAGRLTRNALEQIVGQSGWDSMPPHAQGELIDKTFDRTRESARTFMMVGHPDLLQAVMNQRIEDMTGSKANGSGVIVPPLPEPAFAE